MELREIIIPTEENRTIELPRAFSEKKLKLFLMLKTLQSRCLSLKTITSTLFLSNLEKGKIFQQLTKFVNKTGLKMVIFAKSRVEFATRHSE